MGAYNGLESAVKGFAAWDAEDEYGLLLGGVSVG